MVMKKIRKTDIKVFLSKYGIVFVLLLLCLLIGTIKPQFFSRSNILNVLTQSCIFGIMSLGMTFVIISKGIDLSVGAILAFVGVVMASFAQAGDAPGKYFPQLGELPVIIPVLIALALGAALGAINGFFIAKVRVPPFIATLGMMSIARGLALIYTNGKPVSNFSVGMNQLGGIIGNFVPVPVLIYLLLIIITWVIMRNTSFGKSVYAIGGNVRAAFTSGIHVSRNYIVIYMISGIMAGVAAIVFAGRVGSINPSAANGFELTAIAATTIGGTSHSGGIGTIWGAVVGSLIIAVLRNGLTLVGVHANWQQVIEGSIIVAAVAIDMMKNIKEI